MSQAPTPPGSTLTYNTHVPGWPETRGHMVQVARMTVTELRAFCRDRGLSEDVVWFTGGAVKWTAPETPDERAARESHAADIAERHETWKREMWEKLRQEYGA